MPRLVNSSRPVGEIISALVPNTTPPQGFLACDGSSVTKAAYPALYAVLAGSVTETTTNFTLPDLRGQFLRGLDTTAATIDVDKASRTGGNTTTKLGSYQVDENKAHAHEQRIPLTQGSGGITELYSTSVVQWTGTQNMGLNTNNSGGNESRPKNYATNFFIRY